MQCAHCGCLKWGNHHGLRGSTFMLVLHSAFHYLAQIVTTLRCQLLAYLVNFFNDRVLPHIMFPITQSVYKCEVPCSQGWCIRVPSEHTS